jgi:hypothetical protein
MDGPQRAALAVFVDPEQLGQRIRVIHYHAAQRTPLAEAVIGPRVFEGHTLYAALVGDLPSGVLLVEGPNRWEERKVHALAGEVAILDLRTGKHRAPVSGIA